MSFLARLFARTPDPRETLRPLWHQTVAVSREPGWYEEGEVEDSVEGRFDMITIVLALVILRMERSEALAPSAALITELFVEDMDRQLREKGVGDLMVGKHIGKLMSALGGRIGALRDTLPAERDEDLRAALSRNVALTGESAPQALADRVRALHRDLETRSDETLLEGSLRA